MFNKLLFSVVQYSIFNRERKYVRIAMPVYIGYSGLKESFHLL